MLERIISVLLIPALLLLAIPPVDWDAMSERSGHQLEEAVTNILGAVLLGTRSDENSIFVFTRNVPDQVQPSTTFTIVDSVQAKVDLQVLAIVPDLPAGFELVSNEERAFELNISAGSTVDFIYEVRAPVEEGTYSLSASARGVQSGQDSQAITMDMSIDVSEDATEPPDPPDPPDPPQNENQRPTAFFSASHQSATVGDRVTFDASNSSDPDGSIANYLWNFGDGTTAEGQAIVQHEYTEAGTYQISLTVVDDEGASSNQVSQTLSVEAPPPPTIFGLSVETAMIVAGAVVAAALILFYVRGSIGGGGGQPISDVNDALVQSIQEDVDHFLLTTGVPLSGVTSIEIVEAVEDISRARWVRMLTNGGLIVVYSPENEFQVVEYDSLSLNEVSMLDPGELGSNSILEFVSEHIAVGDTIVRLTWETLDGETFQSMAAIKSDGKIKYDSFMSLLPLAITAALQY